MKNLYSLEVFSIEKIFGKTQGNIQASNVSFIIIYF